MMYWSGKQQAAMQASIPMRPLMGDQDVGSVLGQDALFVDRLLSFSERQREPHGS